MKKNEAKLSVQCISECIVFMTVGLFIEFKTRMLAHVIFQ